LKVEASKEYARRGKPAKSTKWPVPEILRFMKWNLAHASEGDDLGGVASKLPKPKRGSSEPASLPQEVIDWEAGEKVPAPASSARGQPAPTIKRERGDTDDGGLFLGLFASLPEAPMPTNKTVVSGLAKKGFPQKGYQLGFHSQGGWSLVLAEMDVMVQLPEDNYVIYTMDDRDIVLGEKLCKRPVYCEDLLNAAFQKERNLLSRNPGHQTPRMTVLARIPTQLGCMLDC